MMVCSYEPPPPLPPRDLIQHCFKSGVENTWEGENTWEPLSHPADDDYHHTMLDFLQELRKKALLQNWSHRSHKKIALAFD